MFEKGQRKFTIAVEGNIASGKSTLLEQLREGDYAQIVEEPVTKWQNLMPGPDGNLIGRMYEDAPRWGFTFQSYVLLTMMEAHATPQEKPLLVLERSVYSARYCFIENLRKSDPPVIDEMEYEVYKRWYEWLMAHHRPKVDLIVYLRTDPEVCMERLKKRARSEEAGVPLDYLQSLHKRYEEWLIDNPSQHGGNVPVLVLDGNRDAAKDDTTHYDFCEAINAAVQRTPAVSQSDAAGDVATEPEGVAAGAPPPALPSAAVESLAGHRDSSPCTPKRYDVTYPGKENKVPDTPTVVTAEVAMSGRELFPSSHPVA